MNLPPKNLIVTGGQYGSEGKGALCWHLAPHYPFHIRVGGPQAGHSINPDGQVYKFQTLPVGSMLPNTTSVLAMASVVDAEQMAMEGEWVKERTGAYPFTLVDGRATLLEREFVTAELDGGLTQRLGSTSHGVGAARAARIMRTAPRVIDKPEALPSWAKIVDTSAVIRSQLGHTPMLVEAAQGHLLSLFSGEYPFVTSSECGPTQAFADMGLPLKAAGYFQSLSVFRTLPIRVHGNSGRLPNETTWEALRAEYGQHIPTELTTVTRKVRRVGHWDDHDAMASVRTHRPDRAAITFLDYPFPADEGKTEWDELTPDAKHFVLEKEEILATKVAYIGTSFGTFVERGW